MTRTAFSALAFALTAAMSGCSGAGDSELAAGPPSGGERLRISAAASLHGAFTQIAEDFANANPQVTVEPINFDGSSTLVEQILGGDGVDVFAAADLETMERLETAGQIAETPKVFATNTIVLAIPAGADVAVNRFEDVANEELSVAMCAPEVPCGATTNRLLEMHGLEVTPVTLEQNVTAVATKVAMGEVDAGFVYTTDIAASDGKLLAFSAPTEVVNTYPIGIVEGGDTATADRFISFVLGPDGQRVLREFGFGSP